MEKQRNHENIYAHKVGAMLRDIRIKEELSQQDVVHNGNGFSRNTLIAMELGKFNFGVESLVSVLNAMGYDLAFVKHQDQDNGE